MRHARPSRLTIDPTVPGSLAAEFEAVYGEFGSSNGAPGNKVAFRIRNASGSEVHLTARWIAATATKAEQLQGGATDYTVGTNQILDTGEYDFPAGIPDIVGTSSGYVYVSVLHRNSIAGES